MPKQTGGQWKVAVDIDENQATPNWVDLPEQTECSVDIPKQKVDSTSKDTDGWVDERGIRRQLMITVAGYNDDDNTAILYLTGTNYFAPTTPDQPVHLKATNEDGDVWEAWFTMNSFPIQAGESGMVTYNGDFSSRIGPGGEKPTLTRA